jgi:hypothetical protein
VRALQRFQIMHVVCGAEVTTRPSTKLTCGTAGFRRWLAIEEKGIII